MFSTTAAAPRLHRTATVGTPLALVLALCLGGSAARGDEAWVELVGLDAWKQPTTDWEVVGATALNVKNPRKLDARPGKGVITNAHAGRAVNLVSKRTFADVEMHAEFMVPKEANSGIKLEEVYEIQIYDSHDAKRLTASHCGGVYPRAELLPTYHHIDQGYPPMVNACKPPGEWQTLDIVFRAPRFNASGRKTANARFVSVKLNGQIVQENLDLPYPTGNNWRNPEHPSGSILLQGDHGTVAFRDLRVRPLP